MALKIVTGGTTGAADGTLVSSSNKITFTAVDTPVNAHMRCDDDTYSADETFTLPSDGSVQVSFDGGSTWYGAADSPRSVGVDIGDLNVAIKLRQHASTASTSGSFSTDGTFVAASALADVTGFTVTPGDTQNAVSWSAVANRTRYQVDRATNSGFTTGVTLGVYTGTGTSFTDTGLTNGTTYYYRIKAIGTGRYNDSANYATGNGAPSSGYRVDNFTDTDGVAIDTHTPDIGGTWSTVYNPVGSGPNLRVKGNKVLPTVTGGGPSSITVASWLSGSSNADCAAEVDGYLNNVAGGAQLCIGCRVSGASYAARNVYRASLLDDGSLTLGKVVAGTFTSLGTASVSLSAGTAHTVRIEAIGTTIKAYVDGVLKITVTDSSISAGGGLELQMSNPTGNTAASAATAWSADAVRLINT
mgnify:CR=1 FL=1